MPLCGDCAILRRVSVYMQRMLEESTINAPKEADPEGLPAGLRPFERQVIRGMRRATERAAGKERALIVAWLRKQGRGTDQLPDGRVLADAVKRGDYRQKTSD